jgi:hypothetical protein
MQTSINGAGHEARAAAKPQCKAYAHTVRISGGITYQGCFDAGAVNEMVMQSSLKNSLKFVPSSRRNS